MAIMFHRSGFIPFCAVPFLLAMYIFHVHGDAFAQKGREYKDFFVLFDKEIKNLPVEVFDGKRKIGVVKPFPGQDGKIKQLQISVHRDYSNIITQNIFFYVSGEKLETYRLWAYGSSAEAGQVFHGHENQFGIFIHEILLLWYGIKSSAAGLLA